MQRLYTDSTAAFAGIYIKLCLFWLETLAFWLPDKIFIVLASCVCLCNRQQQLNTPCDEETAAVLNDCYMLEEKERLKEEWRTFEEQRKNFEIERRSFTEAAIRLGHEVNYRV